MLRSLENHALVLACAVRMALGPPGDLSLQAGNGGIQCGQAGGSPAAAGLTMGRQALHPSCPLHVDRHLWTLSRVTSSPRPAG